MTSFVKQLQEQLESELLRIGNETNNTVMAAKKAFSAARDTVARLHDYIGEYSFKDRQEEILFYKKTEPSIHAHLVYYLRLYRIEKRKPIGGIKVLKAFYEEELNRIYLFFRENESFYQYCRDNADYLDETFFLPETESSDITIDEYGGVLDKQICTTGSYKVARIMALERLQQYISNELAKAEGNVTTQIFPKYQCKWTGSKVALIELMYALAYSGMINNGQIQIKELAEVLEHMFQTKLGNYYRTRQEMYSRKETASFLELLMKRFRQGMDEADERFRS
jgi:hypothetical protein